MNSEEVPDEVVNTNEVPDEVVVGPNGHKLLGHLSLPPATLLILTTGKYNEILQDYGPGRVYFLTLLELNKDSPDMSDRQDSGCQTRT